MIEWISVNDRLPINGPSDERYDAPFHEDAVLATLANGDVVDCTFWGCWECDGDEFLMEFDVDGVTHWRFK